MATKEANLLCPIFSAKGDTVNCIHLVTNYGTSAAPIVLTAGTPAYTLYTTHAGTSASTNAEPFLVHSTMTGAAAVGGRAKFYMTANVALGGWSNALKAEVVYGASGRTTGLGSALCVEMALSAGTTSGTYAPLEIELVLGSGAKVGTATSFIYMEASGADIATFQASPGYLMNIQGLGSATTAEIFQANTAAAATHALRILIGATPYYIMLTDTGA